jgi:hypothetical protein
VRTLPLVPGRMPNVRAQPMVFEIMQKRWLVPTPWHIRVSRHNESLGTRVVPQKPQY